MQTTDTNATPKKTYDDYLAEAKAEHEYYLTAALAEIENDPEQKQEAERIDARRLYLYDQGVITSNKTWAEYLAEAMKILAKKRPTTSQPYEYYLAQATVEIENNPKQKQEAEQKDARNLELYNQGKVASNKTWTEYLAQAKMIIDESKIGGTALYEITQAENSLYDLHIETGIPMGQIKTPELERYFQNQRLKALENMGITSVVIPSNEYINAHEAENSLTDKARQEEKMAGYLQEAQAIIDRNRSQNRVRGYDR